MRGCRGPGGFQRHSVAGLLLLLLLLVAGVVEALLIGSDVTSGSSRYRQGTQLRLGLVGEPMFERRHGPLASILLLLLPFYLYTTHAS